MRPASLGQGGAFQVNVDTTGDQAIGPMKQAVAMDTSGNFVVVWKDSSTLTASATSYPGLTSGPSEPFTVL